MAGLEGKFPVFWRPWESEPPDLLRTTAAAATTDTDTAEADTVQSRPGTNGKVPPDSSSTPESLNHAIPAGIEMCNFPEVIYKKNLKRSAGKECLQCWVEGAKFTQSHINKDNISLRCSVKGCGASVFCVVDGINSYNTVRVNIIHNHDVDVSLEIIENAKEELKSIVQQQCTVTIKNAYDLFVVDYPSTLSGSQKNLFLEKFPSFKTLVRTMQRWKSEVRPPAPLSQSDVGFNDMKNIVGDSIDLNGKRVITFSSDALLQTFMEVTRLNVDCTFKTAPRPNWASVLIIFGKVGGTWVPLTYTLLPDSGEESYDTAFLQIRNAVEYRGSGFTLDCEVMMDFELNLRECYKKHVGDHYAHKLKGCTFHYGQAIIDYIRSAGFITNFIKGEFPPLRTIVQMVLGIPHVPIDCIDDLVSEMKNIIDSIDASDDVIKSFLTNFVNTYVQGFWLDGHFSREEFNFFEKNEDLTNNAAESGNNQFYSLFGRIPHRNIYDFHMIVIKRIKASEIHLAQLELEGMRKVKSSASKKAECVRKGLKERYSHRIAAGSDKMTALTKLARASGATTNRIINSRKQGGNSCGKKDTEKFVEELDSERIDDNLNVVKGVAKRQQGRPKYERVRAASHKTCSFCSAIYARGYIKRHQNICAMNPSIKKANGQDFNIVENLLVIDDILKEVGDEMCIDDSIDDCKWKRKRKGEPLKSSESKRNKILPEGFRSVDLLFSSTFPNKLIKTIPATGGCCYASVSWALYGDCHNFKSLRKEAHKFLIDSWSMSGYDSFMTWPHQVIEVVDKGRSNRFEISNKLDYFDYLLNDCSMVSFTESAIELQNLSNLLNIKINLFSYRKSDGTQIHQIYTPNELVKEFSPIIQKDENLSIVLYHEIDAHFEVVVDKGNPLSYNLISPFRDESADNDFDEALKYLDSKSILFATNDQSFIFYSNDDMNTFLFDMSHMGLKVRCHSELDGQ